MPTSRITSTFLALLVAAGGGLAAADEHAGHAHGHGNAHGQATALGKATIGTVAVQAAIAGTIAPGADLHVELNVTPAQPAPKAVRLWIGLDSGRGSARAKAEAEGGGAYHAHVEVPNPLPEGSSLWISVEPAEGAAAKGSLPLPAAKAATAPANHDGHKH